ncbi:MAG: PilT/PilU family type 4a pilus ATPase [candidate division Zixibacteria bacterium]|nr:PilT/PilU family type 4a pilus ATPase [candidate division Zixibacteria bacterium]MBU1469828.1 PilT/PilU family type 4a pilus ATPase [candidate division Zixibacteria bacterium]MBU2624481.1 PilT/PilU family type 4a pilus ATPase [candidate division Zixibacteria bacterium]
MNLRQMLVEMLSKRASDIHIRVGISPTMRLDGRLSSIETDPMTKEKMTEILNQILTPDQNRRFQQRNEMDLALSVAKLGRFRINLYRQRGTPGIAIRAVNTTVPTFEELNLPEVIKKIAEARRGLVIVTGTTGSGKSTTLASMIEHINDTRSENVLTIEDPIEFIFRDNQCIISQREVGGDTPSFASALRHAFRQDPDVIMIGEIRDQDTMATALAAADTGHLVLTTLHTLNAVETISRIISFFPPHQHQQIRLLLAGTLQSVICQRLLGRSDGPGRLPAVEVLIGTASVREYIADATKTPLLPELIESGMIQYGMQTFDQSIMNAYRQGVISYEDAMLHATNPDDFDLRLKGITGSSDRGWTEYDEVQRSGQRK